MCLDLVRYALSHYILKPRSEISPIASCYSYLINEKAQGEILWESHPRSHCLKKYFRRKFKPKHSASRAQAPEERVFTVARLKRIRWIPFWKFTYFQEKAQENTPGGKLKEKVVFVNGLKWKARLHFDSFNFSENVIQETRDREWAELFLVFFFYSPSKAIALIFSY